MWNGGCSTVKIETGVPEGGTMGTLCYTALPNDLNRRLLAEQHGIGLDISVPEIWQGHKNGGEGFWVALERLEGTL